MIESYEGIPICGTTAQATNALEAKWPGDVPRIPWHIATTGYLGSMTADTLRDIFRRAWKAWTDIAMIDAEMAETAEEAFVRSHFARIDGPSNVLAWSMLADNTNSPKTQRYDNGDAWTDSDDSLTPIGVDLVRVAIHEIGHVLGLEHDSTNANAIMRPSYSAKFPKPTERDLQRLLQLGYKKRDVPPPPIPPVPPTDPLPPPVGPPVNVVMVDVANKVIVAPTGWTLARPS